MYINNSIAGEKIIADKIKINLNGIKTLNMPISGPLPICPKAPTCPLSDNIVALLLLSVMRLLNQIVSKGAIILLDKLIIITNNTKIYPFLINVIKHKPIIITKQI